jgi:hypothetical protein
MCVSVKEGGGSWVKRSSASVAETTVVIGLPAPATPPRVLAIQFKSFLGVSILICIFVFAS